MRSVFLVIVVLTVLMVHEPLLTNSYMIRFKPGAITDILKNWTNSIFSVLDRDQKKRIVPLAETEVMQMRQLMNFGKRSMNIQRYN